MPHKKRKRFPHNLKLDGNDETGSPFDQIQHLFIPNKRRFPGDPRSSSGSDRSTVTPSSPLQPKNPVVLERRPSNTSSLGTQTEGFLSITNSSRNKRNTSLTNENNKVYTITTLLEKLSKFDINNGAEDNDGAENKEIISIIPQQ